MNDKELEELLRSREAAGSSEKLEDRIIMMAGLTPQNKTEPANNLWQEFLYIFQNLMIPKPVYALACFSIIGFFIGYADPVNLETSSIVDLGNFLYADQGGLL